MRNFLFLGCSSCWVAAAVCCSLTGTTAWHPTYINKQNTQRKLISSQSLNFFLIIDLAWLSKLYWNVWPFFTWIFANWERRGRNLNAMIASWKSLTPPSCQVYFWTLSSKFRHAVASSAINFYRLLRKITKFFLEQFRKFPRSIIGFLTLQTFHRSPPSSANLQLIWPQELV